VTQVYIPDSIREYNRIKRVAKDEEDDLPSPEVE